MIVLACATTIMINLSQYSWNREDMVNMRSAKIRCAQKFEDAPCLKKFIKVDKLIYRAICGTE